ncbi:pro-cathepsin H isoform X2 [Zalophus californianus]|uniref:Pro-cathepsin H isoform X2 n=1 Tax=Zalophus californianus TaxID=9704 RepID=A0A6J2B3Y7_ZALCA|nr:pro-cathepsin H isoform X2 [Zalophus californianus]
MWVVLPLLCAAAGLLGPPACGATDLYASSLEKVHFKSWMVQHQKKYSSEEYHHRLQTFVGNWRKINAHNAGNHTFKMGLNQFSDMSFAEIKRKYLWSEPQNCSATKGNYLRGTGPYPPFVDWRKKGKFVSPVKNQGGCGSCWTFSTTGALESAIAIKSGKLLSLAEQQLVDCAQNFNNHGCQGGLPSQAFEYIRYNKGIMGEDSYPYKGQAPAQPLAGSQTPRRASRRPHLLPCLGRARSFPCDLLLGLPCVREPVRTGTGAPRPRQAGSCPPAVLARSPRLREPTSVGASAGPGRPCELLEDRDASDPRLE